MADERLPPPVHRDKAKEPVLDFVPLAGRRRQMTDSNGKANLFRQLLQFHFPKPHPCSIAASAIGRDKQTLRFWIKDAPHRFPPAPDAFNRESGSVVICADIDPTQVL